MKQIDRYAVFGHPISHSQSPRIHTLFAEATGQALSYTAQDVTPEAFVDAVRSFFRENGRGLNCTLPLKEQAYQLADTLSPRAQRSKAVNTLAPQADGSIFGENTDGAGLVRDLMHNLGITLRHQRILILGAGGASRGILEPILALKPASLTIANRTAEKAVQLSREFGDLGPVAGCSLSELEGSGPYELILNATAASLSGNLPDLPDGLVTDTTFCYDLAYGKEPTAFVRWGNKSGAAGSFDGIGMLVEQAAEAFQLWRGIRPDTRPVIVALNESRSAPTVS